VNISLLQCQIELKYQNNKPSHCHFNFWQKKVLWSEICGFFVDFGGIFIRKNHSAAIRQKCIAGTKQIKISYHTETKIILIKIIYFILEALQSDS